MSVAVRVDHVICVDDGRSGVVVVVVAGLGGGSGVAVVAFHGIAGAVVAVHIISSVTAAADGHTHCYARAAG